MVRPEKDRGTVLVLDDDDELRRGVRRVLTAEGYDVVEARSAHQALSIMEDHANPVDVVLCDLVLPGLGGREAASIILARHSDIRVLFTSAYIGPGSGRQDLLRAGEPFIQKPFDVPELLSAIDALVAA